MRCLLGLIVLLASPMAVSQTVLGSICEASLNSQVNADDVFSDAESLVKRLGRVERKKFVKELEAVKANYRRLVQSSDSNKGPLLVGFEAFFSLSKSLAQSESKSLSKLEEAAFKGIVAFFGRSTTARLSKKATEASWKRYGYYLNTVIKYKDLSISQPTLFAYKWVKAIESNSTFSEFINCLPPKEGRKKDHDH